MISNQFPHGRTKEKMGNIEFQFVCVCDRHQSYFHDPEN